MTEIPVNCLFNKKKTGCGATELAIRNSIPTLIAMPYVALVKNKTVCRTDDIEVLGVYEDITEWDITQFARTHSPLKIATTYDSLPRVVSALQSIGIDPYKELFLLVDEWHVLFNSYSFRHRAIKNLLVEAAKFDKATYMTATPIEREYMLEELRHLRPAKSTDPTLRRLRYVRGRPTNPINISSRSAPKSCATNCPITCISSSTAWNLSQRSSTRSSSLPKPLR